MKRRGFLGFIGGAAVAGPSMAKAVVAQGMEAMSLGGAANQLGGLASSGIAASNYGLNPHPPFDEPMSPLDPRHWLQRELAEFVGMSAQDKQDRRMRTWVQSLDPDLAVNRSMSLSAKLRIQRDRNFKTEMENQHRHLLKEIERAVKNFAGLSA